MERHLPPRIWELWTRFRRWSRGGRQRWQPEGEVAVHGRPPRRWRTRFERATSHVQEVGPPTSGIEDSGSTVEGTSEDLAVGETNEAPSSGSSSSTPGRVLVAGCVWHWGLRVQFSMVVGWTFLSPWRLSSAPGRAVDPPMQVALASGRFRKEKTMRAPGDEEKELQKETTGNETTDLDHGPAVQGDVKRIAGNSAAQLHSVQLWRMETTDTIGLPGEKLSPVCIEAQCSSFASLLPPASGPDRGEPPSANHIEEVSLSLLPLCCWVWETLHIISGVDLHL
ncbi:uncharacterized protein LOC129603444 isoform X4 [Betta splendens]|uniref:Uncharacterized protein LOC129603444 isoform X4 n=1 Tax=Betta splendens TaxID=158456 RepID=A0A9W2XGB7_BETSP|nr:uncharacterized protein LOC129603444 isoform X4 [Betta splendens]